MLLPRGSGACLHDRHLAHACDVMMPSCPDAPHLPPHSLSVLCRLCRSVHSHGRQAVLPWPRRARSLSSLQPPPCHAAGSPLIPPPSPPHAEPPGRRCRLPSSPPWLSSEFAGAVAAFPSVSPLAPHEHNHHLRLPLLHSVLVLAVQNRAGSTAVTGRRRL